MAFCSNCGTQLQDGVKFCPSCGILAGGAAPALKPAAEKVGNIRKCPACGAEVPSMTVVCPSCGHEFSSVQVANSVQAFFERIDAVDQEIYEQKTTEGILSKTLGGLGKISGFEKVLGPSAGGKRKIALVEGYPIPNSKEDILEFIVLAASRFQRLPTKSWGRRLRDEATLLDIAWKTKCEQAYNKAKLSFGSDQDTIANIESILKKKKIIR
jgi:RNA polymerase subunit RPABC4/transcription elongation factor Spt4